MRFSRHQRSGLVDIDIESWRHAAGLDDLDGRIFAPRERRWLASRPRVNRAAQGISPFHCAALRLWVRKECMIKLGRIDLDSLVALELQPSIGRLDAAAPHFTDFADRRWRISGSVACSGRARVEFCA